MEMAFLGNITKKATRGKSIGSYKAIIGVSSALAIVLSGFLAGAFGVQIIFYITAALIFISTLILIWIKE